MAEWIIIFNTVASCLWLFQIFFAYWNIRYQRRVLSGQLDHIPYLSVVIPVFNESTDVINSVLQSVTSQEGVILDIVVVDDGSPVPIVIQSGDNIKLIRLEKNTGKRGAQVAGFNAAVYDWVVTLDSDTTLAKDALYELYKAAVVLKADAVGGTIYLANENHNWLTKMTTCMYWFSFLQERSSQSYFNVMTCCSGALSIYRKSTLLACSDEYLSQKFLGSHCTAGDDRHLTNMFVGLGKKVCWSYFSKGYTISPITFGGFVKQQLRWSRSHTAAVSYIAQHIGRFHPMFLFFIGKMMFRYVYFVCLYGMLLSAIIFDRNLLFIGTIVLTVLLVSVVKSIIAWLYTREWKFLWLLLYGLMSFFVFTPLLFYGLLTPLKTGWLTRGKKSGIITGGQNIGSSK